MRLKELSWLLGSIGVSAIAMLVIAGNGCTPAPVDPPPTQQLDADGDGVPDVDDQCADTPANASVDATGCPTDEPPSDTDGDDVPDEADQCANTAAGATVDETGCEVDDPVTQPVDSDGDGVPDDTDGCPTDPNKSAPGDCGCQTADTDNDGDNVPDCLDDCPNTSADLTVNDTGCPVSQPGTPDSDDDGVPDDIDQCDGTAAGVTVDANGCVDSDGDGVGDVADDCPETLAEADVNNEGCAPSQLDSDNDGVNDDADRCPGTTTGATVNADGCEDDRVPPGGGGGGGDGGGGGGETAVCGNDVQEAGEECDPPNGVTCDDQCQLIVDAGLPNDSCSNPSTVTNGTVPFSTIDATTDGFDEPNRCDLFGYTHVESDIWMCYTATCSGVAVISLCGSDYDTKLAVYADCSCPPEEQDPLQCSDDNCGLNSASRSTFTATQGESYLIRIGGFEAAQGEGWLTIFCGDDPTCGEGAGDCMAQNDTPACEDPACCQAVCSIDQYCCDVEWDSFCGGEGVGFCGGLFAACDGGTGSCDAEHDNGGCEDQACCQAVCSGDPFCCLDRWDGFCVDGANEQCGAFDACAASTDSCLTPNDDDVPGCSDQDCCLTICQQDIFCCTTWWDQSCVDAAVAQCGAFDACATSTVGCLVVHRDPGCNNPECCQVVCEQDSSCCTTEWDQTCVDVANAAGCR